MDVHPAGQRQALTPPGSACGAGLRRGPPRPGHLPINLGVPKARDSASGEVVGRPRSAGLLADPSAPPTHRRGRRWGRGDPGSERGGRVSRRTKLSSDGRPGVAACAASAGGHDARHQGGRQAGPGSGGVAAVVRVAWLCAAGSSQWRPQSWSLTKRS
jgi:hypothetical protein